MAIIAAERTIEQLFERDEPGGLWAALARAADAPAVAAGDVWRGLERRMLTGEAPAGTGMWVALAERVDPTQYRPCAVPDVAEEQVLEGDQTLTVMRSPRGTYLRLTAPQREVWHQMDGTRTVAQLATKALIQFKQLLPIGDLVTALRTEGFLTDRPVGIYRAVGASLESRTAEGWGRRVLRVLSSKSWQFQDIDGFYSAIYRAFGWLLFTPVFLVLWGVVALIGLAAFVLLLLCPGGVAGGCRAGDSASAASGLPLAIVGLWVALLVSFFLHESAH